MSVELPSDAELKRYVDRCRGMSEDGKYSWWSRLSDILTALDRDRQLSQASHGAVRVRELEWWTATTGDIISDSIVGRYRLGKVTANTRFRLETPDGLIEKPTLEYWPEDEAKAAAQADFARRILASLEPAAPEGQQPVACGSCGYTADPDCPICSPETATRPSEQAVTEAFEEVAQWHEKNARYCHEASEDDPRLNADDRKRAREAGKHHAASAAAIRNKLIVEKRAALKAAMEAGG